MNETRHFFVYRLVETPASRRSVELFGQQVETLTLSGEQLRVPFDHLFDEVQKRIEATPGGYCEWDGAFGYNPIDDPATRVCGTIHCIDERVLCYEFHASLTADSWSRLRGLLGLEGPLACQFPEHGVLVSGERFVELLSA